MNTKTKITLIIGLLAIVASCVYPPWQVVTGRGHAWSDGYAFMFDANDNRRVDIVRLAVEWLAIVAVCGAVCLMTASWLSGLGAWLRSKTPTIATIIGIAGALVGIFFLFLFLDGLL